MPETIDRGEGRHLFGVDPQAYDRARPPYPARVYEILCERLGLREGSRTLEIGAGTGLATVELVARGAHVVAVEPDARLAKTLRERVRPRSFVRIIESTFEAAELADERFDHAVSATAFHWLPEEATLAKVRQALRPGGGVALWWQIFGDPERPDPFHEATAARLESLGRSPSVGQSGRPKHALDREARTQALERAGFEDVWHEQIAWTHEFDAARLRDLYASFTSGARLPEGERRTVLDFIEGSARRQFGGRVVRPMLTAIYTARRP